MNLTTHSQAGQDLFVGAVLGEKRGGRFIEIGSAHPVEINNTYALETQRDWRGIMIDISTDAIQLARELRKSPSLVGDATSCPWNIVIQTHQPTWERPSLVDYASVDIDEWTNAALANLLAAGVRARVMTVEHDYYQRGDRLRLPNREIMAKAGYALVAADVHSNGCCFEDWFVDPERVETRLWAPFGSTGLDWADVLRKGGYLL